MRRLAGLLLALGLVLAPGQGLAAADAPDAQQAAGLFALPATPLRAAPPFSDLAGRRTLVILFQPECAWCEIQFRHAASFADAHPEIAVVAVSLRGTRRDLVAELHEAGTDLAAYRGSPALMRALGQPAGTPRVYMVAENGKLVAAARGAQPPKALAALAAKHP